MQLAVNWNPPNSTEPTETKVELVGLSAFYGKFRALAGIDLKIPARRITAIIGPSGCGKSTLLRSINRMNDLTPGARVEGQVLLDGEDLYAAGADVVDIRRRVGMVFQRPTPFPTMSIYDNVAAGLRVNGVPRGRIGEIVERALNQSALWDEVKDRLHGSATALSGGQQQRLCIARALATEPEVLLMDEPASALDPLATQRVEELMVTLKEDYTIVVVTHNLQQAARVSDYTGFFYLGELVEFDETAKMFTNPSDSRTEAYITGRFG
jgi:phosphate transport system ATP-binding protein